MTWEFTPLAEEDLQQIIGHLLLHASPGIAEQTIDGLEKACDKLAKMPALGTYRPDWTKHAVRFWLVEPYWLVYRPNTTPLEIVRVLHTSRDIPRVL